MVTPSSGIPCLHRIGTRRPLYDMTAIRGVGLMYAADEQDWAAGARAADAGEVTRRAAQAGRTTSG
jgi:hypothetical protein